MSVDPSGVRTSLPISEWPEKHGPHLRGTWYARRLKRGTYTRRPHYYVAGDKRSLCEKSTRESGDLVVNPDTGRTMEVDPLIGDYQSRTLCGICLMLLEPSPSTADIVNSYVPMWTPRDSPGES
jgi:hypothetical protein